VRKTIKLFKKEKGKTKGGGVWNNKQKESAMLFKWQEQTIKTRNCSRIGTDKQNNLNSVRRNKNVTVV
jgi:Zn ribbon nucleic-acid-binding protein